jgi:hypothetical protein
MPPTMEAAAAPAYYRRSLLVSILKGLDVAARFVLPRFLYRPLHKTGLFFYRGLIRLLYLRKRWFGTNRERARLVHRVMPYSLVGAAGLEATYDAVRATTAQGSIVECGVAQGGCAALMCLAAPDRKVFLFDSYEGLPDPTEKDYEQGKTGLHARDLKKGECLGTVEQVSSLLFDRFKLDRARVTLVKGWFQDTLAVTADQASPIAVLRIDADWYESVKCCLDALYDRVAPGGAIIIDDYGSCFGARKAVDEFLAARGIVPDLRPDGRGGVALVKSG